MKFPAIKVPFFKFGKKEADQKGIEKSAVMPAVAKSKLDLEAIKMQFAGLQGRPPGLWPAFPRVALLVGMFAVVVAGGFFLYWNGLVEQWEGGEKQEISLKADYVKKLGDAVNLEALKVQRTQVIAFVDALNKQLPSRAEMDALLTDINQAGTGRGLQFELFKPGNVAVKEYYAELPISVRVLGSYHDIGKFTSDIANMRRIVTLSNMNIVNNEKSGLLAMDATAKTYRYLDQNEIDEQRKEKAKEKASSAPPAAPAAGAKK